MKTDKKLGEKIHKYLLKIGKETPMQENYQSTKIDQSTGEIVERKELIEDAFHFIMDVIGLDLKDDSLRDTPKRVAKMYIDEIFAGLDYDNFPKCTAVDNKMNYDEMLIVDKINVQSFCEHHFVSIDGQAKIGYIPNGKVIGLSKLNRIVRFFSKRPQIQERLTEQIFYALVYILGTDDVAVTINASHLCVKSRGVEDLNSMTKTNKLGGKFRDNSVRNEFMNS